MGDMSLDPLAHKVRPLKRRNRKQPLSEQISSMYRTLSITLIIMLLVITGTNLFINGANSAKGYTLKQLQETYESLQSEQRKLEHQIVNAQSFLTLEEVDALNEMESSENEDFSYANDKKNFAQQP